MNNETELNYRKVYGICVAYEQGFGHGLQRRNLGNPYPQKSENFLAWDFGYKAGELRSEGKMKCMY